MEADFTLVPIGGLGNRINAICSAIVYCQQQHKSLNILWFRDHGLNCPVSELFSLNNSLKDVFLRDAGYLDLLLRDNPRRKNFYIPKLFQKFLFDRSIYTEEVYHVVSSCTQPDFGCLDNFRRIFMVSYWRFWESPDMWKSIVVKENIKKQVDEHFKRLAKKRVVGIHIRRTDNAYSVNESPLNLFIDKIEEEISVYGEDVVFYLASDSKEVKEKLKEKFNQYIYTLEKPVIRNSKEGIIDAFVEMNVLSKTNKLYASSKSSFSELAHLLSDNDFEELKIVR